MNSTHPAHELIDKSLPGVVGVSGGRSSAYLVKMLLDQGNDNLLFSFQNTGKEKPETLDFIHEIEVRWNVSIVWLEYSPEAPGFIEVNYETASRNGEPFEQMLIKKTYLPNQAFRLCTYNLKVKTLQAYLKTLDIKKYNSYAGIRADEPSRVIRMDLSNLSGKNGYYYILPLAAYGVTKKHVNDYWATNDFDLQIHGDQGNCDLCFLKGKQKLIRLIRANPSLADWWIDMERHLGKTFIKNCSYAELKEAAIGQQELDMYWPEIECIGCHD